MDFDPTPPPRRSNIPELTVSELANSLKRTLEDTYARVRVRGELSRVKIHSSGHLYSDLKDQDSVLNIICWRTSLARLAIRPEEGLEVICTGKITSYPARSNYQMVVESMELAGEGALLKMLEDRRKRLAAEGLFDDQRKKRRPYLPQTIGVVTSPTGAVIRDIIHRIEDRFPAELLVWPVRVQSQGAAEEIAAAISGFNALDQTGPIKRPDLLIVARGGGSLEDLMPFNEEIVVRAAAASQIPLISAVGHETDTTLIDFAADLRAPTPTAAAEMAVPEWCALMAFVEDARTRLLQTMLNRLSSARLNLKAVAAHLSGPQALIDMKAQSLDRASDRLSHALERKIATSSKAFLGLSGRILSPAHKLGLAKTHWQHRADRLTRLGLTLTDPYKERLVREGKLLDVLSFKSVLARGYAVIRDKDGQAITSAASAPKSGPLLIELRDGAIKTKIEETHQID